MPISAVCKTSVAAFPSSPSLSCTAFASGNVLLGMQNGVVTARMFITPAEARAFAHSILSALPARVPSMWEVAAEAAAGEPT